MHPGIRKELTISGNRVRLYGLDDEPLEAYFVPSSDVGKATRLLLISRSPFLRFNFNVGSNKYDEFLLCLAHACDERSFEGEYFCSERGTGPRNSLQKMIQLNPRLPRHPVTLKYRPSIWALLYEDLTRLALDFDLAHEEIISRWAALPIRKVPAIEPLSMKDTLASKLFQPRV
jgi:hypothetical protein